MTDTAVVSLILGSALGSLFVYGMWRSPVKPWLEEQLWRRDQRRAIKRLAKLRSAYEAANTVLQAEERAIDGYARYLGEVADSGLATTLGEIWALPETPTRKNYV